MVRVIKRKFHKIFDDANYEDGFLPLRESGRVRADPCGWIRTSADFARDVFSRLPPISADANRYYVDHSTCLSAAKASLLKIINRWEQTSIEEQHVTLTPSVSIASNIVLYSLKQRGINEIIFETPVYFATVEQAKMMGFKVKRIPTFFDSKFSIKWEEIIKNKKPIIYWISQPRSFLGFDQNISSVNYIINNLGERDYIVIDEANEQKFPSHLSEVNRHINLIRIRSFFKPVGLNGIRLSFILHDESLRSEFQFGHWIFGGALDASALNYALAIIETDGAYESLLRNANFRSVSMFESTKKLINEKLISANNLMNGYIGTIILHKNNRQCADFRNSLIKFFYNNNVPLTIGPTMTFAESNKYEVVRINYFSSYNDIAIGIKLLNKFQTSMV